MAGENYSFSSVPEFTTFRNQVLRSADQGFLKTVAGGLQVAGQTALGFHLPESQMLTVIAYLTALMVAGERTVASELNRAAIRWQREIVYHCPVDTGLLRMSFGVVYANPNQGLLMEAAVGTNVPYAVYIEFGTKYIAGGAVKDWEPGQAPILDWHAKQIDQHPDRTAFSFDHSGGAFGRGRNLHGQFVGSKASARAEFMPPMRGSWPIVAPEIIDRLRNQLALALQSQSRPGGSP